MIRFVRWYDNGEYTPFGYAYDIGYTCETAICNYKDTQDHKTCGLCDVRSNGNVFVGEVDVVDREGMPVVIPGPLDREDEGLRFLQNPVLELQNAAVAVIHGIISAGRERRDEIGVFFPRAVFAGEEDHAAVEGPCGDLHSFDIDKEGIPFIENDMAGLADGDEIVRIVPLDGDDMGYRADVCGLRKPGEAGQKLRRA